MLTVKEVENLDFFRTMKQMTHGEDVCPVPLFHGTSRYALQMSEQERQRLREACHTVMVFAKKIFKNTPIDDDALNAYVSTVNPLFLCSTVYQYGGSLYQYGEFYVSTGYPIALGFSYDLCGELANCAYCQYKGFLDFHIALEPEVAQAAKIVAEHCEAAQSSEKVVLVFFDVKIADLRNERGSREVTKEKLVETCFEDDEECVMNLRLSNPQNYTGYILGQQNSREGFSLFTEIRNLEYYLKWHGSKRWDF